MNGTCKDCGRTHYLHTWTCPSAPAPEAVSLASIGRLGLLLAVNDAPPVAPPPACRICGPVLRADARADGSHDAECAYCYQVVRCPADRPLATEGDWLREAQEGHSPDCGWLLTRGESLREPKPLPTAAAACPGAAASGWSRL